MTKVAVALRALTDRLQSAGVPQSRLDARLLLAETLGVDASWLFNHPDAPLDARSTTALDQLAARRCRREPMSLILGRREFWSMEFQVTANTLAPRPDSETLVEAVLAAQPERQTPMALLDLGTGSGCLLLALLQELPHAQGVGVDCDAATLSVAAANARSLGLLGRCRFVQSDWCDRVVGSFDVIIANPPYIASDEIDRLEPEVALYEPRRALDGGADGLCAFRQLAGQVGRHLRADGLLVLEIGAGQAGAVCDLVRAEGLTIRAVKRDLAGIERCIVAGF